MSVIEGIKQFGLFLAAVGVIFTVSWISYQWGYRGGETDTRQKVLMEQADLKQQILSKDELLEKAYLYEILGTKSLSMISNHGPVRFDDKKLMSIEVTNKGRIITIKDEKGFIDIKHRLCYVEPFRLQLFTTDGKRPEYFFQYNKVSNEEHVTIAKLTPAIKSQ